MSDNNNKRILSLTMFNIMTDHKNKINHEVFKVIFFIILI